jgi:hypothetical protein
MGETLTLNKASGAELKVVAAVEGELLQITILIG